MHTIWAIQPLGRLLTEENLLVEKNAVPVCHYISFVHKKFPDKFTIIDSVAFIEVHLDEGDCTKACPRIRKLIHEGIKKCAEVLHYRGRKDMKEQ